MAWGKVLDYARGYRLVRAALEVLVPHHGPGYACPVVRPSYWGPVPRRYGGAIRYRRYAGLIPPAHPPKAHYLNASVLRSGQVRHPLRRSSGTGPTTKGQRGTALRALSEVRYYQQAHAYATLRRALW